MLTLAAAAMFVCDVVKVHDGDGPIWCKSGERVRVAGIQAPDFTNAIPCRTRRAGYVCNDRLALRSQRIVERMLLRRSLTCVRLGTSYGRVVARCRFERSGEDVGCAIIAAGAAVRWDAYWRRYRLGECTL